MVRSVWRWLVFGVVLSALLTTVLPVDAFAGLTAGAAAFAFGAALGISLPLYVCATASVPIAAALVAAGMPTGAALVFLMAGPATNVATLGAVYRTFGRSVLAVYLTTIIVGSIGFGLLYEQVFGELVATVVHDHEHTAWWAVASAVGLTAMLGWFAVEDVRGWLQRRAAAQAVAQSVTLEVGGLTCGGCANKLQRALLATDGVETAVVSHEAGTAEVTGSAALERLRKSVVDAGFEPIGA